jgi:hypothetical protein
MSCSTAAAGLQAAMPFADAHSAILRCLRGAEVVQKEDHLHHSLPACACACGSVSVRRGRVVSG